MENISCTVWFAFLLDEGTDIVPLHINWPLPSGRWAEPGRPDLLSVLPGTTGLSCWLESNKPHSGPKGTQTTIWVFGLQTHGCYIHAKSPLVWILGAVVHKCCQAHSEKHIKDFVFTRVIGEDLIRYEMLKVCSTAPIFNTDFMDTETGQEQAVPLAEVPLIQAPIVRQLKGCHPWQKTLPAVKEVIRVAIT